jgi:hypothetical protein
VCDDFRRSGYRADPVCSGAASRPLYQRRSIDRSFYIGPDRLGMSGGAEHQRRRFHRGHGRSRRKVRCDGFHSSSSTLQLLLKRTPNSLSPNQTMPDESSDPDYSIRVSFKKRSRRILYWFQTNCFALEQCGRHAARIVRSPAQGGDTFETDDAVGTGWASE